MLTKAIVLPAAVALVSVFLGIVAASGQDTQRPSSPVIEEVYLAKDDGGGKAGEQVTEFATGDIPIHCVVLLDSAAKVTVKMNFVAVAVAGVRPDTKVVTASYTTSERQNRVNFTGHPEGKWTPGRYRVDLFIDGKPQKQVEFSIKGSAPSLPAATKFVDRQKPARRKTEQ